MRLFSALILVLVPAFSGCSPFVAQCDGLSETGEQVACLDTAFEELRTDADACYDERRGERTGEEFDWVAYCEGLEPDHEDFDRCLRALEGMEHRELCEELEPGDQHWDRCHDSQRDLDGLHERARGDVEREDRVEARRTRIREGLRDGRDLADCERGRERGEPTPCEDGDEATRLDETYLCVGGEWVLL